MDAEGRKQHVEELKRGGEEDNIPFDCPIKVEDDNVTEEETSLDPFVKTEDLDIVENDLKIEVEEIETVIKEEQERTSRELELAVEAISEVEERPALEEMAAGTAEAVVVQPSTSGRKGKGRMLDNDDGDECFRPSSPRKIHRPSARKNMDVLWGRVHPPAASQSPSTAASPLRSASPGCAIDTFLQEEEARRHEWRRQAAGMAKEAKEKLNRALELLHVLKGEEICIRRQRESLREQLRTLDAQEETLDKRKRSAFQSVQKYKSVVAKFKGMHD